jgi:hypothetical protein
MMSIRSARVVQNYLSMLFVGVYILLGNYIICYMSGTESVLNLSYMALGLEKSLPTTLVLSLGWIAVVGVLTDGVRPFLKKFASLLPEKVNMFTKLTQASKEFIHEKGLFDLSNFDTVTENTTRKALAQFNHQLVYLAKRLAEYYDVGDMLIQADKETDLYTLFAVASIGMTVQCGMYLATIVFTEISGPEMGQSFLISLFGIYLALSVMFTNRAKVSMLHGFFHASNLLNDLPYLHKIKQPKP